MIAHWFNKSYVIFVSLILLLTPLSYAQQLSDVFSPSTEKYGEEIKKSDVVNEVQIQVSEDGKVTILDSDVSTKSVNVDNVDTEDVEVENVEDVIPQAYDNTCPEAYVKNLNTWYLGYVDYNGDDDWRKWDLPSSGTFTVDLDVPSNKDYELEVYSSCGNKICSPYDGTGTDEQCVVSVNSGWVYARVYGYSGAYSASSAYYIKGSFAASNQYDLIPWGFIVTPSSPNDQDSISILYEIKNDGSSDITGYFNYKLYIDDVHYQTCNANNGLTAGWYSSCTRTGITLSEGMHTLKIIVDPSNNVGETNENNNIKTQSLTVSHVASYDLVPGNIDVSPSSPSDKDSITFWYKAINTGPDDINDQFRIKFYIDDVQYGDCNYPNGLDFLEATFCERSGVTLAPGTYTLKTVVDTGNQIGEADEGNNEDTESLSVTQTPVDLAPSSFVIDPSSPKESDSITIWFTVVNLGPEDVTDSFVMELRIDNSYYGECTIDDIDFLEAVSCIRNNINLNQGTYTVKNEVDLNDDIIETNENNNIEEEPLTVSSSCPSDKPYKYDGSCHACPQDSLECGDNCYDKQTSCTYGEPSCGADNSAFCCNSEYPYACPAGNICFQNTNYCDGRPIYSCQDKKWVCIDSSAVGTCTGNTLNCCPSDYPYYWASDQTCRDGPFQQVNCDVPDGSSSQCDCDTNSDCPSSHPYCEQNYAGHDSGYDGCLSSEPEHCGDGICSSNENYNSCSQDCIAPEGKINVDVFYSNNNNAMSGAHVYLDSVSKSTTDSNGKKGFDANYGSRNVKVECPDKTYCNERTVHVDGTEYVSFGCSCSVQESELQLKVRALHSATDEGYPIYNAYIFLDQEKIGLTDTTGNFYISNVNYGSHQLGIGMKIADEDGGEPYDHRYSVDIFVDEQFEEHYINVDLQSQQQSLSQNINGVDSNTITVTSYDETYAPEAIPLVVVAIVWVGFVGWAYGDYAKCVEETDSWWAGVGKNIWYGISCNPAGLTIGNAINKDHIGNCIKKSSTLAKNTWEKCKLDATFLGVSFIPAIWIAKALGKVFVVLKGTVYSIPYVEKFLGYGIKVIKESDTFIKVSDGVNTIGYKVISGSLKVYDNVVGMIVKIMNNAGVSNKITTVVDDLLRATTPSDLPGINTKHIGNVKGALGEKVSMKQADMVGEELVKEGAVFVRPAGNSGTVFKETSKYKLVFNDKGNLDVWEKAGNRLLGDFDDFYKINDKWIVTEVKTMSAGNLDMQIPRKWSWKPLGWKNGVTEKVINRLEAVKEVTGQTPEFILMIPKGEAAASKQLPNLLKKVRNAGFKAETAELKATNEAFDIAARRIKIEAETGG